MLVLTCTNTVVSLFRKQIPHDIRIPIYVMIIATTVTVVAVIDEHLIPTRSIKHSGFYSFNCDQLYCDWSCRNLASKIALHMLPGMVFQWD